VRKPLLGLIVLLASAAAHVCAQAPARVRWQNVLEQPADWYTSPDARAVADNVLRFQRESGGWPKDIDMMEAPKAGAPARPDATIDNGATTTQIRLLSQVPGDTYRGQADPARSQELFYVLDGLLTLTADDQEVVVPAGASSRLRSDRVYAYRNASKKPVQFLRTVSLAP